VTTSLLLLLDLAAFIVWARTSTTSAMSCAADATRARYQRPIRPTCRWFPCISPAYQRATRSSHQDDRGGRGDRLPNFEVIVIDNNTRIPRSDGPSGGVLPWSRARSLCPCRTLARLQGRRMPISPCAAIPTASEIIGLIDAMTSSTYYLKETVPYFSDPHLGFLQKFRGQPGLRGQRLLLGVCRLLPRLLSLRHVFRNERDSVPSSARWSVPAAARSMASVAGTSGASSEGHRGFAPDVQAGWSGLYIPRCFGRGVVPPTYAGLNTQRHRCLRSDADLQAPLAQPLCPGTARLTTTSRAASAGTISWPAWMVERPPDVRLRRVAPRDPGLRLSGSHLPLCLSAVTGRCYRCRSSDRLDLHDVTLRY